MQEAITDLQMRERAELGMGLMDTAKSLTSELQGFRFRAAHFDSRDYVWVLAASKNIPRADVLRMMIPSTHAAMAFYGKRNGMIIVDRDGSGFEIGLSLQGYTPNEVDRALGEELFGRLRMASRVIPRV
jgi:hypothetical protein